MPSQCRQNETYKQRKPKHQPKQHRAMKRNFTHEIEANGQHRSFRRCCRAHERKRDAKHREDKKNEIACSDNLHTMSTRFLIIVWVNAVRYRICAPHTFRVVVPISKSNLMCGNTKYIRSAIYTRFGTFLYTVSFFFVVVVHSLAFSHTYTQTSHTHMCVHSKTYHTNKKIKNQATSNMRARRKKF